MVTVLLLNAVPSAHRVVACTRCDHPATDPEARILKSKAPGARGARSPWCRHYKLLTNHTREPSTACEPKLARDSIGSGFVGLDTLGNLALYLVRTGIVSRNIGHQTWAPSGV